MSTSYHEDHDIRLDDNGEEIVEEAEQDDLLEEGSAESRQMLRLARILIQGGFFQDDEMSGLFDNLVPPPTSKKFIQELKESRVEDKDVGAQCPICLVNFSSGNNFVKLPCGHKFHKGCVLAWLKKTCSCPLCRYSLPTDDPAYEELRKRKKMEKQRKFQLEELHNSMFG